MKKVVSELWNPIRKNRITLLLFEMAGVLFMDLIYAPIFEILFNKTIAWSGVYCITNKTLPQYLIFPTTWLVMIPMFLLFLVLMSMEIMGLLWGWYYGKQNKTIRVADLFRISFQKGQLFVRKKNFLYLFFLIGTSLTSFSLIYTNTLYFVYIPVFIMNRIMAKWYYMLLLILGSVVLGGLSLVGAGVLPASCFDACSFRQAWKNSIRAFRVNWRNVCLFTVLFLVVSLAARYLLIGFSSWSATVTAQWLSMHTKYRYVIATIYECILLLADCLEKSILSIASIACIGYLYWDAKQQVGKTIPQIPEVKSRIKRCWSLKKHIFLTTAGILLIGSAVYFYLKETGLIKKLYLETADYGIEITAHRGGADDAPENTLAAFGNAVDLKVDWIEVDVRQTKDGTYIICHDPNLKRISGLKKNVWSVTWEEIQDLDVGSYLSSEWQGITLCTLEEFLSFCEMYPDLKINIELKTSGHYETGYEAGIVEAVEEHQLQDRVVFASLNLDSIRRVKTINPELKTAYIMMLALGDLSRIKFADYFSISQVSVKANIVRQVHAMGKEIWVWTVEKPEDVRRLFRLNVDNIITDNVSMVQAVLQKEFKEFGAVQLIKLSDHKITNLNLIIKRVIG